MSSISIQGVVSATAIAAVSATMILLALRHKKFAHTPRPCISSDGKQRNKEKRVRFAEDVVDPPSDGVEFRKRHMNRRSTHSSSSNPYKSVETGGRRAFGGGDMDMKLTRMPANRAALYNGMLRNRVGHRMGYSC